MDIVHRAHLGHELPKIGLADALVEVADVDSRVFILLPIAIVIRVFIQRNR